jgi:hypothetical protein
MQWTSALPKEEGYYFWCDFYNGPVLTAILKVEKDCDRWLATNEEYNFEIRGKKRTKSKKESDAELWAKGLAGGEDIEFWCKIPEPQIPLQPSCVHPIEKLSKVLETSTGCYDLSANFVTVRCECGEIWRADTIDNRKEYARLRGINCKEKKA